ncbi:hypothetical protein BS297_13960, partial [Rhodococcus erythropolis]
MPLNSGLAGCVAQRNLDQKLTGTPYLSGRLILLGVQQLSRFRIAGMSFDVNKTFQGVEDPVQPEF